jgi:hypothetical protein
MVRRVRSVQTAKRVKRMDRGQCDNNVRRVKTMLSKVKRVACEKRSQERAGVRQVSKQTKTSNQAHKQTNKPAFGSCLRGHKSSPVNNIVREACVEARR